MQFHKLFATVLILFEYNSAYPQLGALLGGLEEVAAVGGQAAVRGGTRAAEGAGAGEQAAVRGGTRAAEGAEAAGAGTRGGTRAASGISHAASAEIKAIDHASTSLGRAGSGSSGASTPRAIQAGEKEAVQAQNAAKTAEIEAAKNLQHMRMVALAREHDQFEFIYRVGEKGGDFKKKFSELRPKDFPSNHPFDPKTGTSTVHPPHEGNGLSANRYPGLAKEQSGDVLWKADRSEIQKGGKFKIHDDTPATNADNPTHSSIANTRPMTVDELKAELNQGWTPVERRITTKNPDGTKTYRWEPIPEAERAKYMGAPPAKPVKPAKAPKPAKPQAAGNGNRRAGPAV